MKTKRVYSPTDLGFEDLFDFTIHKFKMLGMIFVNQGMLPLGSNHFLIVVTKINSKEV